MVDIHCHLVWAVDDGAKTLEESVAMARLAAETGTTDIVATPHANNEYEFQPELVRARVNELNEVCGGRPKIHPGADFHLSFQNIEEALRDPRPFAINGLRYLMVELPELIIPPTMGDVFERMLQTGILPVITHPERNRAIWNDERVFERWLRAGCYVQITAQSLEGHFGRTAREMAWKLLEDEKVHFIASDGHDLEFRPPRLDQAHSLVHKRFGADAAQRLFRDNPRKVIEGITVDQPRPEKQKSRFRLFR